MNIEQSINVIHNVVRQHRNPVILCSFGKDSMVLLDLIEKAGYRFPILFHREPFFPEKYAFANRIIMERGYAVYDYAPGFCVVTENDHDIEIVGFYHVGKKFNYLPTGIDAFDESQDYLCGYKDLYLKPKGSFDFPWDVCFIGHKASDVDPIYGRIPIELDIKQNVGSAAYAYPLREWTDEDIWTYTVENNIPVHEERYDRQNGFKEFADHRFNPDYFPACVRCLSYKEAATVWCPKMQMNVNNISGEVGMKNPPAPDYIQGCKS